MSLAGLLKNVYSFLDVLQQANSPSAHSWAKEDVKNALKWAEFCEKIYSGSVGRSFADKLDRQIRTLGRLSWSLGNVEIRLEYLKDAKFTLQRTLLQNPHLSNELVATVLEMVYESEGEAHTLKVLKSLNVPKTTLHQLLLLTRNLWRREAKRDQPDLMKNPSIECEAALFKQHFEHVCKTCEDRNQLRWYLVSQMKAISTEPHGLKIILSSFLQDDRSPLHHHLVVSSLQDEVLSSEETRDSLGTCPADLLCSVATKYTSFIDTYLHWLVKWGSDMTIRYTPKQRPGYMFSPRSNHFSSFPDFANHFLKLLKQGPEVCRKPVINLVLSKSKESEVSVWYELRRYLLLNL